MSVCNPGDWIFGSCNVVEGCLEQILMVMLYVERLNAGIQSLGPLEVYQHARPWKCKNSNSLVI